MLKHPPNRFSKEAPEPRKFTGSHYTPTRLAEFVADVPVSARDGSPTTGTWCISAAALVFVEVTPDGRISPGGLGIWGDEHIEPLARIARFVYSQGAVVGIQLAHAGRKASCDLAWKGGARLKMREEGGRPVVAPGAVPFDESDPPSLALEIHTAHGIDPSRSLQDGSRPIPITDDGKPSAALFA